ncbi:MAG: TonB-dependent receptor [Proteobacteria bacterium]|nr:TonB-dependent receptor [Pseudomonadota bacterium]
MNTKVLVGLWLLGAAPTVAYAADETAVPGGVDNSAEIEEIISIGVRQRLYQQGTLKNVIQKTEIVDAEYIRSRQAVNLSQAIATSPGVKVSNECSMCGVKRIMLNGMRGEHTTILTDGMPLHTMLAGYYAVDAIATTGIERVEVARGAGASLIAPEAIGGTINVVSRDPGRSSLLINAAAEEDDGYMFGGIGSLMSDDGRHSATLVTQFNQHERYDGDGNGVSEAPLQDNRSIVARLSSDFTRRDNVVFRAALINSEIFGGPMDVNGIADVLAGYDGIESDELFVNGDVRERFIGQPWETAEWIETDRIELSASWVHEFSGNYNTTFNAGYSEHEQDSFYEGFDYAATDELVYLDFRNNLALNGDHLLTFGVDRRDEQMRSESAAGEDSDNYIEDSFDYDVLGFYLQDTWNVTDKLEAAIALRVDRVKADFVAPEKPGTEIDETVFAPRIDTLYRHDDSWSSRLSVGKGYRAPLSFFETDHGILDAGDGFAIDIDRLEESLSVAYALSFEGEKLSTTLSLAYTEVEDLAAMDETEEGVPLLTQLEGTASVFASDIAAGYKVTDQFTVSGTIETFDYDDAFRSSYAIAPIEERATLALQYNGELWSTHLTAVGVGSRDLSKYGYEGFDIFDTASKSTHAESFWTVDMKITRALSDSFTVYVGAFNLFDESQGRNMQSPLFWDPDGAYDVGYIYGPLRGREYYAGFEFRM